MQPESSKHDITPRMDQVNASTLHIDSEREVELLEIKSEYPSVEEFQNRCSGIDEAQVHSGIEEVSLTRGHP